MLSGEIPEKSANSASDAAGSSPTPERTSYGILVYKERQLARLQIDRSKKEIAAEKIKLYVLERKFERLRRRFAYVIALTEKRIEKIIKQRALIRSIQERNVYYLMKTREAQRELAKEKEARLKAEDNLWNERIEMWSTIRELISRV